MQVFKDIGWGLLMVVCQILLGLHCHLMRFRAMTEYINQCEKTGLFIDMNETNVPACVY
ncbi:hypothetical protein PSDVSF_00970 [Pseudodesulfovibrio sediminis]|uniref:Uncharacterized protein n=1 Tax=Pseudodesulfovibrio sediminis TaxID=2810563 RepID=A0ABM7P244_9BACT|nr:hypothetical protein PSDVSF_00970 [Pseudodesulfovibrio sediminis]